MKRLFWAVALTLGLLSACGSQPGSEFLGTWVSVKNEKIQLQIERNGESFMIRRSAPALFAEGISKTNIPASFQDGMLSLTSSRP